MTQFKEKDFVKVELDLFANEKLVQTTSKKKAQDANLDLAKEYGPQTMVVGKEFLLKALDEDIKDAKKGESKILDLSIEDAFGKRKKDLLKIFQKKVFTEQKLRVVPGVTYDFNGMYGTVKSVVGGRVMVDFNNPLAGKKIRIEYTVVEKVEDIKERLVLIFKRVLKFPENLYKLDVKENNVSLKIPKELNIMKDQLLKAFEEYLNDYSTFKFDFSELEKPKK